MTDGETYPSTTSSLTRNKVSDGEASGSGWHNCEGVIFVCLQPKVSDVPLLKAEKELKPSSLRVKDAAEAALSCMMDHVVRPTAPRWLHYASEF